MSTVLHGKVSERYPRGRPMGEYLLALALADIAKHDGTSIFPSVATMAYYSYQDTRSVQRHLRTLLDVGWLILVRAHRGGRGDAGKSAEYRISPRWIAGEDLPGLVAGKSRQKKKGDKSAPFPADPKDDKSSPFPAGEKGDKSTSFPGSEPAEKRTTNNAEKDDKQRPPYKNGKELSTPLTPPGGSSGFDALCSAYPAHRVNFHQAQRRYAQLKPDERLAELMVRAARAQSASAEWQANNGHAVPNLSGWILNKKWRATHDEREAPAAQTAVTKEAQAPVAEQSPEEIEAQRLRAQQARERARQLVEESKRGRLGA